MKKRSQPLQVRLSFRACRQWLEITGAELGELLNVRTETISRWETGRTPVNKNAWMLVVQMTWERMNGSEFTKMRLLNMSRRSTMPIPRFASADGSVVIEPSAGCVVRRRG